MVFALIYKGSHFIFPNVSTNKDLKSHCVTEYDSLLWPGAGRGSSGHPNGEI